MVLLIHLSTFYLLLRGTKPLNPILTSCRGFSSKSKGRRKSIERRGPGAKNLTSDVMLPDLRRADAGLGLNKRKEGKKRKKGVNSAIATNKSIKTSSESPGPAVILAAELLHVEAFFAIYPGYYFDPMQPIMLQFETMAREMEFKKKEYREAKDDLREAMVLDFNDTFGEDESDLGAWQRLCIMLEVSPVPNNIRSCHAELRKIHVNIVDLLQAAATGETPEKFSTVEDLRIYTEDTGNIFPLNDPRAGGVLRALLRRLCLSTDTTGYWVPRNSREPLDRFTSRKMLAFRMFKTLNLID
ncbi:hypothetical protein QCA50_010846 [Cerrena zonata]|uniref:Uncharacterized protein n=1 Tax=Cerrena zonata TaxID=2478898 RepID=A0AAW0G6U9_9APHY